MYFNQSATSTVTHLSTNQHQTIPKNKAATNPYQHQKKKIIAQSTTKHQLKAAWIDTQRTYWRREENQTMVETLNWKSSDGGATVQERQREDRRVS